MTEDDVNIKSVISNIEYTLDDGFELDDIDFTEGYDDYILRETSETNNY